MEEVGMNKGRGLQVCEVLWLRRPWQRQEREEPRAAYKSLPFSSAQSKQRLRR